MEIDIDVYFWLVDRGVYDDDQRNKVDMERNKVKMLREHSQRLENGYYIAKLMMILKKSVMKISRKPFSLDPNLGSMKDNITSTSKQMNWNIIVKELKKFGIRLDGEKKAKIIEGRPALICDILARLFEFDNGGGQSRFADGVSSEINFGGAGAGDRDHSSNGRGNLNDSTNISVDGKDSSILLGVSSSKRKDLEPLSPRIKGGKKSKLPLNLMSPNIKKVKAQVNQSVTSLNEMNEGKELGEAETTLEFILLSLAKSLAIKPKQAAGLLSNNHKYLIHIAVKGMKGNDYSKMMVWYQNIYGCAKQLTQLIENEKEHNAMKLTLNILKCGLYSQNSELVITCSRVLSKLGQEINLVGGQLAGLAWDWFIDNSGNGQGSNANVNESDLNMSILRDLSPGAMPVQPAVLNESGLSSCLYAIKKNQSEAIESITPVIIHFGRNNYIEFFTYHLKKHFSGEFQRLNYITIVHDIIMVLAGSSIFNDAIVNSGVLDELVSQGIRMADYDPSGGNSQKERIAALAFLADIWETKSDKIEENYEVAQAILTVLKRGCRDRSRILRTVSFEQMFKLLQNFSLNRNQFAPIIYKSLTFLLIEFHYQVEIREQLMRQFVTMFQQVQTIPVSILCEPLLKQIAISGANTVDFNIFDFEFFGAVANHKRSTVSIGLQIIDTMVAQATTQVFYANSATSIVLELVHRFSREQPMHQHMSKVTESLMAQLDESEKWKKANPDSLLGSALLKKGRKGLDPQQQEQQTVSLARKMRERLIVNFLKQVILFGIELVKEDIRTQLLRTYTKIEQQSKIKQPKSLHYLLQLYRGSGETDVPQMLQYYVEQEKMKSKKSKKPTQPLTLNPDQFDEYLLDQQSANNQLAIPMDEQSTMEDDRGIVMLPKKQTKAQVHLDKIMREIDKIKTSKAQKTDRKALEDELRRVKDEQMKSQAKKKVERRLLEHGVLPIAQAGKKVPMRGVSLDQRAMGGAQTQLDRDGKPLEIKIIRARDIDGLSEIQNLSQDYQRRISLLPEDTKKKDKSNVLKSLKEFQLFDLRLEEQKDQDAVRFFVKKNLKVIRNLFNKYANTSGPINTSNQTFEELQNKNQIINVAEVMKFLKEFQVTTLQASQKDVMQLFRAINKDIFKKKDDKQGANTVLDFEGFVELLMQLAVHLYSFNSAMTPAEYLMQLFEQFRQAAMKTNSNLVRLFPAPNTSGEDGLNVSAIMDNNLIAELNRRLARDPLYVLPEGYSKVTERVIENRYALPEYFPIQESQRVSVEVLDGLLNSLFGIHILEPMSEIKEFVRARPNLSKMTKDKVMSELATNTNKNALPPKKLRTTRADKVSSSIDVNPIKGQKNTLAIPRDNSRAEMSKNPLIQEAPAKLQLGVTLKLEVVKMPASHRPVSLEAAYALEEILNAVEQGLPQLPRLKKEKKKPQNKIIEERMKKIEEEERLKVSERQKLDQRKVMLKEQLDKMKVEKVDKEKEEEKKKKLKEEKEELKKKKQKDLLKEDLDKLKLEFAAKREKKLQEIADKKALEPKPVDAATKAIETKELLKQRKSEVIESMQKKVEERKQKRERDIEQKAKKEENEQTKNMQIKKMYEDTKTRGKEIKDQLTKDYEEFKESYNVVQLFEKYDRSLQQYFELQTRFDNKEGGTLSYNAYMNIGKKTGLTAGTGIISGHDYIYVYKTLMKSKKQAEAGKKIDFLTDVQGTRLSYPEFKEALLKIACLGKYKLGGQKYASEDDAKMHQDRQRQKVKDALNTAAKGGVLKKPKDDYDEGNVHEDLISVFEKEFNVDDMTEATIESLFIKMGIQPSKPIVEKKQSPKPLRGGDKSSSRPGNQTFKIKVGDNSMDDN